MRVRAHVGVVIGTDSPGLAKGASRGTVEVEVIRVEGAKELGLGCSEGSSLLCTMK